MVGAENQGVEQMKNEIQRLEVEKIKSIRANERKQTLEEVQKKFINCVEHSDFEDWLEKELSK